MHRSLLALLALPLFAVVARGQTVHEVQLAGFSYSPAFLEIQVGDVVRWTWVSGNHNVVSGQAGSADGNFSSGNPTTAPNSFAVLFDEAFLAANPMPANEYPYFCATHTPGMTGLVRVLTTPAEVEAYGSFAPPGSLTIPSGSPVVGGAFTLRLQDTANFTGGPGAGLVFLATAPDPAFPAGTPLAGFGLGGPGDPGELLLSTLPPNPVGTLGPKIWGGAFSVVDFAVNVPADPSFAGNEIFLQGVLVDPVAVDGIGLTNGLRIVVGS